MTTTALSLLASALGACAVLTLAVFVAGTRTPSQDEIGARLSRYGGGVEPPASAPRVKTGNAMRDALAPLGEMINPLLARTAYTGRLAEELQKADLRLKGSEWMMALVGVGLVIGVLVALRFGNPLFLPAGLVFSWFGFGAYLRFRQSRRRRAFDRQLGETIILLSNALKAGYSFAQAIATVSKSAGPPIGDEFSRATREVQLGISTDDALNHMVQRNKSEDFDFLVTAVQIQRVVGGNLAEILDTIAYTIRERVRITGEIRTLTAQARFSGIIITILPIALAVLLSFISPDYFRPMLTQTGGWIMLGIGLFSMAVGYAMIQKIVKIEV